MVEGADKNKQQIIRAVLSKKGIVCLMEGSMAYDVKVPEHCVRDAKRLLHRSPELKGGLIPLHQL